jgi:intracellular septation protein
MKALYDFFPLLLFFAAFKLYGIYTATAVAIAASFIQVGLFWIKHRRFETMHLVTLGVLTVFGGMTIAFHDDTFIKWKPTIVNWAFSAILFGGLFMGEKTIMEKLMGKQMALPNNIWKKVDIAWALFFLLLGALNIYVAFYYQPDRPPELRQETWVNFKVFGILGITLVFAVAQALFLARHMETEEKD